jgi:ABC-type uncharacterized transport system substrate-binding protein
MGGAGNTLRTLTLGLALIAGSAAVLLYSDLGSRERATSPTPVDRTGRIRSLAIVQPASHPAIDAGIAGMLEVLASRGYADGQRIHVRRYNAGADIATATAIAREVTTGTYDLIVTVTTTSLQTVARANAVGARTPHVFGMVTDPYSAGVGINRENHLDHPPYMTGYGSMQPIAKAFALARRMRSELRRVGLIWTPAESNSVAQTNIARVECQRLGITLLEANAENASSVAEAAGSLVARGVDAIWISGDVTVAIATDAIVAIARRARIPVFTVTPPAVDKGTLFDLGADDLEIGRRTGALAADVLDGKSTAEIPVENMVPELLMVNRTALRELRDLWEIPDDVAVSAAVVIDDEGRHVR